MGTFVCILTENARGSNFLLNRGVIATKLQVVGVTGTQNPKR